MACVQYGKRDRRRARTLKSHSNSSNSPRAERSNTMDTITPVQTSPATLRCGLRSGLIRLLPSAKGQDSVLQYPDAGEPEGCGRGIKPAKLRGQRRDTLAKAVCFPGRPGKS